ncbi:MAG: DUF2339 domain-containing protein [Treponema sp.]|jgi:uncharacterized membrane protein|nr:DUF2339 domain-containing protein [Treponema sp.]
MEFLLLLIIGAFLFAVLGVIGLLVRTKRLNDEFEELRREIRSVSDKLHDLSRSMDTNGSRPETMPVNQSGDAAEHPDSDIHRLYGAPVPASAAPDTPIQTPKPESPPEPVFAATARTPRPGQEAPAAGPVRPDTGPPPVSGVPETRDPEAGAFGGRIAAFIHGGNIWAAGGVLLLIAAFAMLMTYMARRGFFTLEMRIAAAALSGLIMLVAGWVLRKRRPLYFLILQGGGIGILYLTVFAAYKLTGYFPVEAALTLMSVLVPAAVIIALFQNSQALAFFGFLGGFAAPILLAGENGHIAFLFSYYTVLSLGILATAFFRSWKFTSVLGFAANFGAALGWALNAYTAADFAYTEAFVVFSIVVYTLLGIILLERTGRTNGANGGKNGFYLELALILGTPLLGAVAQWKIFSVVEHGYALVSLVFAVFYIALAFVLLRLNARRGNAWRIPSFLIEAYGALALFLANLVIPLELSPIAVSAIWAAEGAVVYYMGLRRGNTRILAAGLVIHAAAAVEFIVERPGAVYGPLRSAVFTGTLIIAASAFAILILTKKAARNSTGGVSSAGPFPAAPLPAGPLSAGPLPAFCSQTWYAALLVLWGLLWYFSGWGVELWRIFGRDWGAFASWSFIAASGSALLFFTLSKLFGIALLNLAAAPSLAIACFAMLGPLSLRFVRYFFDDFTGVFTYNYLRGLWLWAWLGFIAVHAALIFFSKKTIAGNIRAPWIFVCSLIILPVLTASLRHLTTSLDLAASWTALAGIAPFLAGLFALSLLFRRIAGADESFRLFTGTILPWILCGAAALWFTVTLFMPGSPAPLPLYLPVLNPLELQEALCAVVIVITQMAAGRAALPSMSRPAVFALADVMGFFWITSMLARSVHFFAGIPFGSAGSSDAFKFGLFVFWAFWGIGHIILGSRLALRPLWIAGAILTVADIAKLLLLDMANTGTPARIVSFFIAGLVLLFIGWAAPLPPALKRDDT